MFAVVILTPRLRRNERSFVDFADVAVLLQSNRRKFPWSGPMSARHFTGFPALWLVKLPNGTGSAWVCFREEGFKRRRRTSPQDTGELCLVIFFVKILKVAIDYFYL